MSYSKAVTGWRRLAAITGLVFVTAVGPAAAAGDSSGGGGIGSGSSDPTPTVTTPTPTTTFQATTTTFQATVAPPARPAKRPELNSPSFGARMLHLGMRGADVTVLQRDLAALNFRIPATGRFNRPTLTALRSFQRRYHLTADGVAGPSTISTLKRLLNSRLHIAESAAIARELAHGIAVTATTPQPLPAGDSGLSGGVGLTTTTATGTTTTTATVQDATLIGGIAVPAPGTPAPIVRMLDAANSIAFDPYIYGGGHGSFIAPGYDCSGSVSYVLHAGDLLATPLDSEQFLQYGLSGPGSWITIYTNGPTHMYMEIAGLWFDTAAQTALNGNDRWSLTRIAEPGYGKFIPRHPAAW